MRQVARLRHPSGGKHGRVVTKRRGPQKRFSISEVADIPPSMPEYGESGSYKALLADIKENGQLEPGVVYKGEIIDGKHRERACHELGIEFRYIELEGEYSIEQLAMKSMSYNVQRRHLTAAQRADYANRQKRFLQARRKIHEEACREAEARKEPPPDRPVGCTWKQAAKVIGASAGYMSDMDKLERECPKLHRMALDGDLSIPNALAALRLRSDAPDLYNRWERDTLSLQQALRELKRRDQAADQGDEDQQERDAARRASGRPDSIPQERDRTEDCPDPEDDDEAEAVAAAGHCQACGRSLHGMDSMKIKGVIACMDCVDRALTLQKRRDLEAGHAAPVPGEDPDPICKDPGCLHRLSEHQDAGCEGQVEIEDGRGGLTHATCTCDAFQTEAPPDNGPPGDPPNRSRESVYRRWVNACAKNCGCEELEGALHFDAIKIPLEGSEDFYLIGHDPGMPPMRLSITHCPWCGTPMPNRDDWRKAGE